MATMTAYLTAEETPTRDEVDKMPGSVLLEFGTEWCGFCRASQPAVKQLLEQYPDIRHVKVEDGPGRPLGRSFRVKLWPNFVFMRDGAVVRQMARPSPAELKDGFAELAKPPTG
jgi:thioredoxin 1